MHFLRWKVSTFEDWEVYRRINIGSGNGFVPGGTKPLPEPLLTKIHNAMGPLGNNELNKQ